MLHTGTLKGIMQTERKGKRYVSAGLSQCSKDW